MQKTVTTYPRGKLCEGDEGQLEMRLGVQDKTVVLDFGKDLSWLGFSKDEAIAFGQAIINKAKEIP
jgi:hypothetical protein